MLVCQFSTDDGRTAAGTAAVRTNRCLLPHGCQSFLLVNDRGSDDPQVLGVDRREIKGTRVDASAKRFFETRVLKEYRRRCAINDGATEFTLPFPGADVSILPLVREARVLHLHSVADFLSPLSIRQLGELGKPLVWSFHDSRPMTGGCRDRFGCTRHLDECSPCAQLQPYDPNTLPRTDLRAKRELFEGLDFTIVVPSAFAAEEVRRSPLFRNKRIEIIGHPTPNAIYRPSDWSRRARARRENGIDDDAVVVVCQMDERSSRATGEPVLQEVLREALHHQAFRDLCLGQKVVLVCLGRLTMERSGLDIAPIVIDGPLTDAERADVFGMADLMLAPRVPDFLPVGTLEAMICGLPVLAFDHGSVQGAVVDGDNGRLVPMDAGPAALAAALVDLVQAPGDLWRMGRRARRTIESRNTDDNVARTLLALYDDLVPGFRKSASMTERFAATSARASIGRGQRALVPELLDHSPTLALDGQNSVFLNFLDRTLVQNAGQDVLGRDRPAEEPRPAAAASEERGQAAAPVATQAQPAATAYGQTATIGYGQPVAIGTNEAGATLPGTAHLGQGWSVGTEAYAQTTGTDAVLTLSLGPSDMPMALDLELATANGVAATIAVYWGARLLRHAKVTGNWRTLPFAVPDEALAPGGIAQVTVQTAAGSAPVRLKGLCIRPDPSRESGSRRQAAPWLADTLDYIDRDALRGFGMSNATQDQIHAYWSHRPDLQAAFPLDSKAGWIGLLLWCLRYGRQENFGLDTPGWVDLHAALRAPTDLFPGARVAGLCNLAVALHMSRADLQEHFDPFTASGLRGLAGWYRERAHVEYPEAAITVLLEDAGAQGLRGLGLADATVVDILRLWTSRNDVFARFNPATVAGALELCAWVWLSGRHEGGRIGVAALIDVQTLLAQPTDLGGDGKVPAIRLAHVIHAMRPDLQAVFPLDTAEGRAGLNSWFLEYGVREYRVHPLPPALNRQAPPRLTNPLAA